MDARDTVKFLAVVASYEPNMPQGQHVTSAWLASLGDLPYDACVRAVIAHYRTDTWPIKPAHVRRHVLVNAGMLAPPTSVAVSAMLNVASHEGIGRRELQPVVMHTYDCFGGARCIAALDSFGVERLRKTYDAAREAFDRATIEREHDEREVSAALALRERKALT